MVWSLNVSVCVYTCHLNLSTFCYNLPLDRHKVSLQCATLCEFLNFLVVKSSCHKSHVYMCGVSHRYVFSCVLTFCTGHWSPFHYGDTPAINNSIHWLLSLYGYHWHEWQDPLETRSDDSNYPIYMSEVLAKLAKVETSYHGARLTLFGLGGLLALDQKFAASRLD